MILKYFYCVYQQIYYLKQQLFKRQRLQYFKLKNTYKLIIKAKQLNHTKQKLILFVSYIFHRFSKQIKKEYKRISSIRLIKNAVNPIQPYEKHHIIISVPIQHNIFKLVKICTVQIKVKSLLQMAIDDNKFTINSIQQISKSKDIYTEDKYKAIYKTSINGLITKYSIKYLAPWIGKKIKKIMIRMFIGKSLKQIRQEFCQKYLKREKQLFYEFNKLSSEEQWFNALYNIYQGTLYLKPLYYASVQILKVQLYKVKQDFVNVEIRYEDHDEKLQFDINEKSYDITQPSFQLIIPVQQNNLFFLSYKFNNIKNSQITYGNTFIQLDLTKSVLQQYQLNLQIKKNGHVVGRCKAYLNIQTRSQVIKQKLRQKSLKIRQNLRQTKGTQLTLCQSKTKQYQYVKFLWGIKHIPSEKIQNEQVMMIVIIRTLLILGLGGFGTIVHVLGRCEPISIIIMFLLLKWRTYVILRVDLFLMTWLIVAAMLLDCIWLVFSSHHVSQINYLNLPSANFFTYILLGVKALFFIYLLAYQRPFRNVQIQSEAINS